MSDSDHLSSRKAARTSPLCEEDGHDVAESTERDKDTDSLLCLSSEHVSEIQCTANHTVRPCTAVVLKRDDARNDPAA